MGNRGMIEEFRTEAGPQGPMSDDEQADFDRMCQGIDRDILAWREVGRLLLEIRKRRLYRAQYERFEDFCKAKWGWSSRAQIYFYCEASTAADDYDERFKETKGADNLQIVSVRAGRTLAKVQSRNRDAVVRRLVNATTDGRITERVAEEAVRATQPKERTVQEIVICPRCKGTGKVTVERKPKRPKA